LLIFLFLLLVLWKPKRIKIRRKITSRTEKKSRSKMRSRTAMAQEGDSFE